MSIGYACQVIGLPNVNLKSCTLKNVCNDKLVSLISHNLDVLDNMLDYNIHNKIHLFRISSDIIPFGSHPANKLDWTKIFHDKLIYLGKKALNNNLRLSMHPGQYTVLNSPNDEVVQRAIEDLRYHCDFLDSLNLDSTHKIILHIGGVYNDKIESIKRFVKVYRNLDDSIKRRLIIENDDRQYTIHDVLMIGIQERIPVVFDNLHNHINSYNSETDKYWIDICSQTWTDKDGMQKIHYSQQAKDKRPGSHSDTIELEEFINFYKSLQDIKPSIMLEVKDKNLSALKCITATSSTQITKLEKEWSIYKYLVLERSPEIYKKIRELLKDKSSFPAVEFYNLIDQAMLSLPTAGTITNAAQHVWGYVNKLATPKDKIIFEKSIDNLSKKLSTTALKKHLLKLSISQNQQYLIDSLYFMELYR